MKIRSDVKRIIDALALYAAFFFASLAFFAVCGGVLTDDPIYTWWAMASAIATGLMVAYILIDWLYYVMDGEG